MLLLDIFLDGLKIRVSEVYELCHHCSIIYNKPRYKNNLSTHRGQMCKEHTVHITFI